jgi:hypothetical protein
MLGVPDWKVWKLRARDFKNLIVIILKASKLRAGDIRRTIQTFHTGWCMPNIPVSCKQDIKCTILMLFIYLLLFFFKSQVSNL